MQPLPFLVGAFVLFVVLMYVLGLFFWVIGRIYEWIYPPQPIPSFTVWLLNHRDMPVIDALDTYIRQYNIFELRRTADEPKEITRMRMQARIMEECGIIQPNETEDKRGDPVWLIVHQTVKNWDEGDAQVRYVMRDAFAKSRQRG